MFIHHVTPGYLLGVTFKKPDSKGLLFCGGNMYAVVFTVICKGFIVLRLFHSASVEVRAITFLIFYMHPRLSSLFFNV